MTIKKILTNIIALAILCGILGSCLLFVSCDKLEKIDEETDKLADTIVDKITGEETENPDTTESEETPAATDESEDEETSQILQDYLDKYDTDTYWKDSIIPMRYLIYSDDSVVLLYAIPLATTSTAIPTDSISRYEEKSIAGYTFFTIYNKDGTKIEFNAKSGDEKQIANVLG